LGPFKEKQSKNLERKQQWKQVMINNI
jgi:hypothetical protein